MSADYDLRTAEAMLETKRYLYVIFMCHLAIEKTLKAVYAEARPRLPPRSHDLLFFLRELGLDPPRTHREFIGIINNASIPTRYPEALERLVKQYPRRTASSYLNRTRRVIQWLRKDLRLAKMS